MHDRTTDLVEKIDPYALSRQPADGQVRQLIGKRAHKAIIDQSRICLARSERLLAKRFFHGAYIFPSTMP